MAPLPVPWPRNFRPNPNNFGAQFQTYNAFIKNHMDVAKYYITMLHQWFIVYVPTNPQGSNKYGNPVGYATVSQSRWG